MNGIPHCIALIPARSGSKRVPHKNILSLNNHPMMAYTIAAAKQSQVFADVVLSTDSPDYAKIATYYGAEVPFLRPSEISGESSMDIDWVEFTLQRLREEGREYDCFSILRPTNPFRMPETIQRAWKEFLAEEGIDSLRAVEKCKQHPGKMWVVFKNRMSPLLLQPSGQPWHSSQYPSLPEVYVQNASLEISWTRNVFISHSISGTILMPFFTQGYEGFDINQPFDWKYAEELLVNQEAVLPSIVQRSYFEQE